MRYFCFGNEYSYVIDGQFVSPDNRRFLGELESIYGKIGLHYNDPVDVRVKEREFNIKLYN